MSFSHIESMESRQLMSVSLNPVTGLLTATGTNASDQIVISDLGAQVKVQVNAETAFFAKNKVKKIVMNGLGGPDSLRSTNTLKMPHVLNGGWGVDFLRGAGGDDSLNGGDGDDVMDGGYGADHFSGNAGIDTVDYSFRTEAVTIYLQSGPHSEGGSIEHDITVLPDGARGDTFNSDVENAKGGSGNDIIWGSTANNKIWGNGGKDTIYGMDGNDTLYGGEGNDDLTGGAGADTLDGGNGNDHLDSKDGSFSDKLIGGAGFDAAERDKWMWLSDTATGVELFLV